MLHVSLRGEKVCRMFVTCIVQVILPGELTFGFGHAASKIDQAAFGDVSPFDIAAARCGQAQAWPDRPLREAIGALASSAVLLPFLRLRQNRPLPHWHWMSCTWQSCRALGTPSPALNRTLRKSPCKTPARGDGHGLFTGPSAELPLRLTRRS